MPSTIHDSRPIYKIASVPGDGIGPEVIGAGIQVLEKLASVLGRFEFRFDHVEWSSAYYKEHGTYIPEGGLDRLRRCDAVLFGAVGDPGGWVLLVWGKCGGGVVFLGCLLPLVFMGNWWNDYSLQVFRCPYSLCVLI